MKSIVLWVVGLALVTSAWGQTDAGCGSGLKAKKVVVDFDTTGIADWRFLNPRSPYPVVDPAKPADHQRADWDACAQRATVEFGNAASGRALVVTIPYTHRQVDFGAIVEALGAQTDHLAAALKGMPANDPVRLQVEQPMDRLIAEVRRLLEALQALGRTSRDVTSLGAKLAELDQALIAEPQPADRPLTAGQRTQVDGLVAQAGPGAGTEWRFHEVLSESQALRSKLSKWKKDNPTSDHAGPDRLSDELERLEAWLEQAMRAIAASTERPPLGECPDVTAPAQACTFTFTLFDSGSYTIAPEVWRRLVRFSDGTVRFKVSFFDEQVPPTNTEGYLRVRASTRERDSATSWQLTGAVGYAVASESKRTRQVTDAAGVTKAEPRPFTLADPFLGARTDSFNGQASLDLVQTLRDRARGRVTAQFKSGVLGEKSSGAVNVTQYSVDVYGASGLSLRFGKYRMLQPARGTAISETGEGFQLNWGNLLDGRGSVMVGHLVKRESLDFVADDANQDASVTMLQLTGNRGQGPFRHFDLFALYGEQKKPTAYDYNTLGGQFFFAHTREVNNDDDPAPEMLRSASGSVSYFASDRDADLPAPGTTPTAVDGRGRAWLLDAGVTWLRPAGAKTKSLRTLGLLVGAGSGDDPGTPGRDEAYLGETAAFGGSESLLLGSFAEPVRTLDASGKPTAVSAIGKGLANKLYAGASYVERAQTRVNLLWWMARGLDLEADVESAATTLRVHWFHLDEPFGGERDAGWEAGLQWQIQVPAGVKTTLGCSHYFPGGATEGLFRNDPMSCSAQVSLTLK